MTSSSSRKGKRAIIFHSASSSDQEDEEDSSSSSSVEEDEESESEIDDEGSEEEYDEEESLSEDGGSRTDYDSDDDDKEEDEEDDDEAPERKLAEEQLYNKVIDLLQRRKSLNTLKLEECKAYLRKHELRLSGTKATCIERILEHRRIKDGNGEKLYPRASFVINCTGDVCTGDVILFKQKVYEKFDIVTRGGNIIGKRVIAGRVVKESYGAAKQQHTFTVEILWCKGMKSLPSLFPLLVKGRNLYRLKTFRQRWSDEARRSKVLAEKHKRGAAARHVRSIAKARSANRGCKRQRKSSASGPPSNKRRKKESEPPTVKKQNTLRTRPPANGPANTKRVAKPRKNTKRVEKPRNPDSFATHPKQTSYHGNGIHTQPTYPRIHTQPTFPQIPPFHSQIHAHNYSMGYLSAANGAMYHHMMNRGNYMSRHYGDHPSQFDPRRSSHRFSPSFPPGEQFHGWR